MERTFSSLKNNWLLKIPQPTRQHMRDDVAKYMRYCYVNRLHSANADKTFKASLNRKQKKANRNIDCTEQVFTGQLAY